MLRRQPLGGRQRHGRHVFRHRFGIGARVIGNRDVTGNFAQRQIVDPGRQALHETAIAKLRHRLGPEVAHRVIGHHRPGGVQRIHARGARQIGQESDLGESPAGPT